MRHMSLMSPQQGAFAPRLSVSKVSRTEKLVSDRCDPRDAKPTHSNNSAKSSCALIESMEGRTWEGT